jgi:hypothetical protein
MVNAMKNIQAMKNVKWKRCVQNINERKPIAEQAKTRIDL